MKITKTASAKWSGNLKEGKGHISTESGALKDTPYGFNTRFEDKAGTNPEELLGAAHAGCFTMALSKMLGEENFTADEMNTEAKVVLEKVGEGFSITGVQLKLEATIPGIEKDKFMEIANKAKEGCPVSKLFNTEIILEANLRS